MPSCHNAIRRSLQLVFIQAAALICFNALSAFSADRQEHTARRAKPLRHNALATKSAGFEENDRLALNSGRGKQLLDFFLRNLKIAHEVSNVALRMAAGLVKRN